MHDMNPFKALESVLRSIHPRHWGRYLNLRRHYRFRHRMVHVSPTTAADIRTGRGNSSRLSIQEPFGISIRPPFDRSSMPLRALLRPGATRRYEHAQTHHGQPRIWPELRSSGRHGGFDCRRFVGGRRRRVPGRQTQSRRAHTGHPCGQGSNRYRARRNRPREGAGKDHGSSAPVPQAHDRARHIAEGEIVEYASNCAAPIVHKAGEIRPETSSTSHWWQNLGNKTVILFVGDVLHDKNDHNM